MFYRRFLASNVDRAAAASILAMLAFNIYAITLEPETGVANAAIAAAPMLELA